MAVRSLGSCGSLIFSCMCIYIVHCRSLYVHAHSWFGHMPTCTLIMYMHIHVHVHVHVHTYLAWIFPASHTAVFTFGDSVKLVKCGGERGRGRGRGREREGERGTCIFTCTCTCKYTMYMHVHVDE